MNFEEAYAGQLICVPQEGQKLLFSDVVLRDGTQPMPKLPWWKRVIGMRNEAPDFRCKGIGTALTSQMLLVAEQQGIKRIYGSIVQSDVDANSNLMQWYEKMGFCTQEPDDECLSHAIHKIEMRL